MTASTKATRVCVFPDPATASMTKTLGAVPTAAHTVSTAADCSAVRGGGILVFPVPGNPIKGISACLH
jgi:hypothetical protein